MHLNSLAAAALAGALTLSAPAQAQPAAATMVPNAKPSQFARGPGIRHDFCRGARQGCGAFVGGWIYDDGEWARSNNRSWGSQSYNDWWNDRPDRAFPRWVQEQHARGTCDPDRMWWSGSGWHC